MTDKHDMKHLQFIRAVAEEDLRYIDEKDRSYAGSWKRSGGRSAWFMLRRKMDRMYEFLKRPATRLQVAQDVADMLARKELPTDAQTEVALLLKELVAAERSEDIFAMIQADPSGRDGSVLAEVRDLRRYLTLVEAEMIARGVVAAYPQGTNPTLRGPVGAAVDEALSALYGARAALGDVANLSLAIKKLEDAFWPFEGLDVVFIDRNTPEAELASPAKSATRPANGSPATKRIPVTTVGEALPQPEPSRPGTPEDGGHHSDEQDEVFPLTVQSLGQEWRNRDGYTVVIEEFNSANDVIYPVRVRVLGSGGTFYLVDACGMASHAEASGRDLISRVG